MKLPLTGVMELRPDHEAHHATNVELRSYQ